MTASPGHRVPRPGGPTARLRQHLPLLVWLLVLWLLLWGAPLRSPLVLCGGVLVAVGVVLLFPLPPTGRYARVRPLRGLRLAGYVLGHLVDSAAIVAWEAVYHGPRARTGIFEVPLRADNDLLVSGTAHVSTLIPGTMVLEVDRSRLLLYLHAMPLRHDRELTRRREETWDAEDLMVHAFGTDDQVRRLRQLPRGTPVTMSGDVPDGTLDTVRAPGPGHAAAPDAPHEDREDREDREDGNGREGRDDRGGEGHDGSGR